MTGQESGPTGPAGRGRGDARDRPASDRGTQGVGLVVRNLVAGYEPGLPIVRGVSLSVAPGEIVALLGPNGAGKSTLVKAVAGLVPAAGQVRLGDREIIGAPAHRMVHMGLAYVPQTENVFTRMTVEENLEVAGAILPSKIRQARMDGACELFPELTMHRRLLAGRLSGGQRQMLAVARALVGEPRVLVLDEPSAGLAPLLVEVVLARLREIRDRGVAVLVVEQNVRAALAVADRAYVLVEGRERLSGRAATLATDPEVARLYLGGIGAGDSPRPQ